MKKLLKPVSIALGGLAVIGIVVNLWAYTVFQQWMRLRIPDLPQNLANLSLVIILSIFFAAIFHLVLLSHTLYFAPRMKSDYLFGALYFSLLILSGILLLSDAALLSDLGKEYLFWDVTQEWNMLYAFTSLQLLVMFIGLYLLLKSKDPSPFAISPKAQKFDEPMFLITTYVGLICGVFGLMMLPLSNYFDVLESFRTSFIMVLSLLALIPFVSSVIYWLLRNRGKRLQELVDEKQFQDVSVGALLAVILVIILLFAGIILSHLHHIDLNNPTYGFIGIDLILITITSTILVRAKN